MSQNSKVEAFAGKIVAKKYELVESVAEGCSGVVYLAGELPELNPVAIKIIFKEEFTENELAMLSREAEMLRTLAPHPNVILFKEQIDEIDYCYLVLEYCETDLFDIIFMNGSLPAPIVKQTFGEIAAGVAYCHSKGIFHRDIKVSLILE
jgi:5'-AMP-activated protein kinase catalytic alpha subunit